MGDCHPAATMLHPAVMPASERVGGTSPQLWVTVAMGKPLAQSCQINDHSPHPIAPSLSRNVPRVKWRPDGTCRGRRRPAS